MTDWSSLQHAYGSAGDIPDLLAAADSSSDAAESGSDMAGTQREDQRRVWDALWSRLCHQGTVYPASFAALPALAAMANRQRPAGYLQPLHLASSIISSTDGPPDLGAMRNKYTADLGALRDLAERNLALAGSSIEFVYALQSLMAFENVPIWQEHLDCLADGELVTLCPRCREEICLPIEGGRVANGQMADPRKLQDADARLYGLAQAYGRTEIATGILTLLGQTECPHCGAEFDLPQSLVNA